MAFTVEDGDGLANANALISLVFFQDYHTDRGRDISGVSDPNIQSSIIRATDYMEQRFGLKIRGVRLTSTQALSVPRSGLIDERGVAIEGVPRACEKACAEYALRAYIYNELAPDPKQLAGSQNLSDATSVVRGTDQSSGVIKAKTRELGPMVSKTMFADHSDLLSIAQRSSPSSLVSGVWIPEYPTADMWMAQLLARKGVIRN